MAYNTRHVRAIVYLVLLVLLAFKGPRCGASPGFVDTFGIYETLCRGTVTVAIIVVLLIAAADLRRYPPSKH
jgi:hypothetical protein